MMNRRDFLKFAGFTAAGTLLSPLHKTYAAAKTQKPNIIIILADDMGWATWDITAGGSPRPTSTAWRAKAFAWKTSMPVRSVRRPVPA